MGMKVNSEVFYELSLLIPYSIIRKYADSQTKIEALLFGASGLLPSKPTDNYIKELKKEYHFLAYKHKLTSTLNIGMWKFLRQIGRASCRERVLRLV